MADMSYRIETADNAEAVAAAATVRLAAAAQAAHTPVLLVPSFAATLSWRRTLADGPLTLGVAALTPDAWIRDRWELFGDGRTIVSSAERALLVRRALDEAAAEEAEGLRESGAGEGAKAQGGCALAASPGTVGVLAEMARAALPALSGERVRKAREQGVLSAGEERALAVLARYARALEGRGQCEASQAAVALGRLIEEPPTIVLAGIDELSWAEGQLLAALGERADVVRIDDGCRVPAADTARVPELAALLARLGASAGAEPPSQPLPPPIRPAGAVRFVLPAGAYATARLVADEVLEMGATGGLPVVVAAKDPAGLFEGVAPRLAAAGLAVSVSARIPFGETVFGRAFLALAAFACGDEPAVAQASDFALSPFSGIAPRRACELDAAWRGDRTVDRDRILADLAQAGEAAGAAIGALRAGDWPGALRALEAAVRRRAFPAAEQAAHLAAASCARRFAEAAAAVGTPPLGALPLLESQPVPFAALAEPASASADFDTPAPAPAVRIMGAQEAAELPPASCAALIACDLDAASAPVRQPEDARTLLFEKLGLPLPADALARTRRRFFRMLSAAVRTVVCERVLATADADTAYPAVMFEELIDCYRADPTCDDDLDRTTGLPQKLVPFARTGGEDALQANLSPVGTPCRPAAAEPLPPSGRVSEQWRHRIVLPREGAPADQASALHLSPSALESYLECPYKWFSLRRLRLGEPDAGFGPLEMGSFSHAVLKTFYERFRESGRQKVAPDNLGEAKALLADVFAEHRASQRTQGRSRNALIATCALEEAEIDELERKLHAYLGREAALLPGFAPTHFEFDFGTPDPFPYAGCLLRGSIDRIDVNGRGQAVVIDYKGKLTPDYALASCSAVPGAPADAPLLPHKVQALIYAQVARRLLGLEVVGALYVSYGPDAQIAGAFDREVLGPQDMPGIDVEACGVPGAAEGPFACVLDRVEEGIAAAVERLAEGDIAPSPRGGDPCGYCPVLACENRRGA